MLKVQGTGWSDKSYLTSLIITVYKLRNTADARFLYVW